MASNGGEGVKAPILDSSATAVTIKEKTVVCNCIQNGGCAQARARMRLYKPDTLPEG